MRRLSTTIALAGVVAPAVATAAPSDTTARDQVAAALRNMSLFWHAGRADNVTCGTTACVNDQLVTGGYSFVRTEGWVFP